jgi:hypothetical protein
MMIVPPVTGHDPASLLRSSGIVAYQHRAKTSKIGCGKNPADDFGVILATPKALYGIVSDAGACRDPG